MVRHFQLWHFSDPSGQRDDVGYRGQTGRAGQAVLDRLLTQPGHRLFRSQRLPYRWINLLAPL